MSNTTKVHTRFWDAMRARFGAKWLNDQGLEPTAPWVQLLDQHTPDDLKRALEIQALDKREWPPTLDEFAAYLRKARTQREVAAARNYARDFWRNVIVDRVAVALKLNAVNLEPLIVRFRATLGDSMRTLLDEVESMETRTGQRTIGMFELAHRRAQSIARTFAGDEPEALDTAHHTPAIPA